MVGILVGIQKVFSRSSEMVMLLSGMVRLTELSTFVRLIFVWAASTGVPPELRAICLLQKLTGQAFDKLEHVSPDEIRDTDGIARYKEFNENASEPVEDYRVGKVTDEFLDDFSRKKDQEIVDYNNDWIKEFTRAERVAGEITGKWKAHLYLKKMRINTLQKSQVLTCALGQFTVEALQKSAMITSPSIKDLQSSRTSHGRSWSSNGYQPKCGSKHKGKRFGYKRKGHGTHVTDGDEAKDDAEDDPSSDDKDEDLELEHRVNHADFSQYSG